MPGISVGAESIEVSKVAPFLPSMELAFWVLQPDPLLVGHLFAFTCASDSCQLDESTVHLDMMSSVSMDRNHGQEDHGCVTKPRKCPRRVCVTK